MAYKTKIIIGIAGIVIVAAALWMTSRSNAPEATVTPAVTTTPRTTLPVAPSPTVSVPAVSVIASNLNIPWDIAFLPDNSLLVTERGGNLVHLKKEVGDVYSKTIIKLPHPVPRGEGGLLGLVLHPRFAENRQLYLYMTTQESSAGTKNTVFRYSFVNNELTDEKIIIKDIPGALYHDGGRMEFGPDGLLYITTGDAQSPAIAQDLKSLGGKILRLTADGGIPSDNPFGTAVYSYGHRNPQGLAWDDAGRLWETEHGRSGVTSGMDELNLIEKGKNYGWPTLEGDKTQAGMVAPALHSGARDTWAPASAVFHDGSIYFGGLKGEALYEAVLNREQVVELRTHFKDVYGRIRTVRLGPDGMLYLTTSNRDGRGNSSPDDDRIIRINPKTL